MAVSLSWSSRDSADTYTLTEPRKQKKLESELVDRQAPNANNSVHRPATVSFPTRAAKVYFRHEVVDSCRLHVRVHRSTLRDLPWWLRLARRKGAALARPTSHPERHPSRVLHCVRILSYPVSQLYPECKSCLVSGVCSHSA